MTQIASVQEGKGRTWVLTAELSVNSKAIRYHIIISKEIRYRIIIR